MTIIDFNNARRQFDVDFLDVDDIRKRLTEDAYSFVKWLYSNRAGIKGNIARIGDVAGTPGLSLAIQLGGEKAGLWHDHATGEGGDLFDLYRARFGQSGDHTFMQSVREIARYYFGEERVEVERSSWLLSPPGIIEADKTRLGTKPHVDVELGAPVASYRYYDATGQNIIAIQRRFEPDGTRASKTFRVSPSMPHPRPLYRLPEIAQARSVVLVEGEGKADALAARGIASTSVLGGAGAAPDTDWTPLRGKEVVIWPDNDEPGRKLLAEASARLMAMGCRVRVVAIPAGAQESDDVGDLIRAGGDPAPLIQAAREMDTAGGLQTFFKVRDTGPYDLTTAPQMEWVVPGLLIKRKVTMLVAPAGIGKSLLSLPLAIMVSIRFPWAGWRPRSAEKVLIINAEDDYDDQMKRLTVAAEEMGINPREYAGRIMLADDVSSLVVTRYDSKLDMMVRTPLVDTLVAYMLENQIGMVSVDPFAETFEGKENNNDHLKQAAFAWRDVARRANAAGFLIHHTKKGSDDMAGNADASRGGGSLIAAVRVVKTLFNMTQAEAEKMGIEEEERPRYVRLDGAKSNHSPPGNHTRWFKKESVDIGNGVGDLPGDNIGVMVPWKPPSLMDGISRDSIREALAVIARGILGADGEPTGAFFTRHATSNDKGRWVGNVLIEVFGCDEIKAKNIIEQWLKSKVLEEFEFKFGRKDVKGVRCGPVAAEM